MESASVAAGLSRFSRLRALAALLVLALRQQVRGWRLVVLGLLFMLPGVLTVIVYLTVPAPARGSIPAERLDFALLFNLIPHALAPLAALLCAAGIIRDEVEEQTLTYVLLRPLPRMAIYALKLLAALFAVAALTSFFTVATLLFIAWLTGEPPGHPVLRVAAIFAQGAKIAAIFSLAQAAYCGLFALIALLVRRALLIGVVYIIFFEGLLASFDTIARRMTVMYYFRVLVLRWLEPASGDEWKFDMQTAPSAAACVLVLLGAGAALAMLGALIFAVREFRMKTPAGE
jgi:ABC-2 type transport system permease protein